MARFVLPCARHDELESIAAPRGLRRRFDFRGPHVFGFGRRAHDGLPNRSGHRRRSGRPAIERVHRRLRQRKRRDTVLRRHRLRLQLRLRMLQRLVLRRRVRHQQRQPHVQRSARKSLPRRRMRMQHGRPMLHRRMRRQHDRGRRRRRSSLLPRHRTTVRLTVRLLQLELQRRHLAVSMMQCPRLFFEK